MSSIAHQTVVITGAGSGRPRHVHAFSRQNWSVAVADINIEAGQKGSDRDSTDGGEAFFVLVMCVKKVTFKNCATAV